MAEQDPYDTKIWQSYRRGTVVILAVIAFVVLLQYLYLLYQYFVLGEVLAGGAATVGILVAGAAFLMAGDWFAVATWRARDSRALFWRVVGFVAAGTVLPIAVLYFLLQ